MWTRTPLLHSPAISQRLGSDVYLKLENLQISHSFKFRGISAFVLHAKRTKGDAAHLVIASGGNAALAAACAAQLLALRCSAFVPVATSQQVVDYLRSKGTEVNVQGTDYAAAVHAAETFLQDDPAGTKVMVPPYDHEIVWRGHASMIAEIAEQLPPGTTPDVILCSVGGAGLLGGVLIGCQNVGWNDVRVIALETHGASCFHESILLNTLPSYTPSPASGTGTGITSLLDPTFQVQTAVLPAITSRATSLGARSPSPGVVSMALKHPGGVTCVSVPDEMSMRAALEFADEHKFLVELACSTTLVPAYNLPLFDALFPQAQSQPEASSPGAPDSRTRTRKTIVFIVCGGYKIDLDDLAMYKELATKSDGPEARTVRIGNEVITC